MSTGFPSAAKLGSISRSRPWVCSESGASDMPAIDAASAARTHVAPELLIATSRRPLGFQPLR